jgi:hypothetical protein
MAGKLLIAAMLLLVGGLVGNSLARYAASRHRHARAVMTLAQFHLNGLRAAARSGSCPALRAERERLLRAYDELVQAFPLAYAQDEEFRQRAEALRVAARGENAANCTDAARVVSAIARTCEDCHREYR